MRYLFTGIGLLLLLPSGFAQFDRLTIYTKAGLQAGGPLYKSETIISKSGSPGFNPIAGLGISYTIFKRWSVTAEAYYSRRKINYTSQVKDQWYVDHKSVSDGNGGFVDFDIQTTFTGTTAGQFDMKYLELPLNIQYALGNKWRIQAGMYYAWAFSRSNSGTATGIVGRTDVPDPAIVSNQEYNYSNELNSHFYGITCGGQYHLSPSFAIDLRMTYSFKSLYKEAWEGVPYTLKDLYAEATVNYSFGKSEKTVLEAK